MRKLLTLLLLLISSVSFGQTTTPIMPQFKSNGSNPTDVVPMTWVGKLDGYSYLKTIASDSYIDPIRYGADPTGVADATTAIINAANAASAAHKDLVFYPGTYKLTAASSGVSSIDLTGKYVHWKFLGAILKQTTAQTVPVIKLTSSDVDIQGMIGWGVETSGTYPAAFNTNAFIDLVTCDKGKLTDTYIYGKSVGIFLETSNSTKIDRYTFDGLFSAETVVPGAAYTGRNYHNAIRVNGGAHNYISRISSANTGSLVLVGLNAVDTHISDGYVYNFFDNGIYISSSNGAVVTRIRAENGEGTGVKLRGSNNSASYCYVSGTSVGIGATGNGASDIYGFNGYGSSITYSKVENVTRHGIVVGIQDGFYPQGFKVTGNTVVNAASETVDYASILIGGDGHSVTDNYIIGSTAAQAIEVSAIPANSSGITIANNTVKKCSGGIALYQTVRSFVLNNVLDSINTSYAIRLSGTSTDNVVSGNKTNQGFTGPSEIYVKPSDGNINNQIKNNISDNKAVTTSENFVTNKYGFAEYSSLPTAAAQYQSQTINVTSTGSNSDQSYVGQRLSGGSYVWKKLVQNFDDVLGESVSTTRTPVVTNGGYKIDGTADNSFQLYTNANFRWSIGKINTAADVNDATGVGSDLRFTYLNGAGVFKTAAQFKRSTGFLFINSTSAAVAQLQVFGNIQADGTLTANQTSAGIGKITVTASGTTVTGQNTAGDYTTFLTTFKVGQTITATTSAGSETRTISAIASDISMTTDAWTGNGTAIAYTVPGAGIRFQAKGNGDVNLPGLTASQLVLTDASKNLVSSLTLPSATIATTQTAGDNSTKVATTAFVNSGLSGSYVTIGTAQTITGTKTFPLLIQIADAAVSGFVNQIGNVTTLTNNHIINFPDKAGTVAMTSDIPSQLFTQGHSIFTPATGGTVALVVNKYNIINPAGTLATLTVNLPSSPNNNDTVYIKFTQAVTAVTYGNGTVVDGIASPIAGGLVILTYDTATTSWY